MASASGLSPINVNRGATILKNSAPKRVPNMYIARTPSPSGEFSVYFSEIYASSPSLPSPRVEPIASLLRPINMATGRPKTIVPRFPISCIRNIHPIDRISFSFGATSAPYLAISGSIIIIRYFPANLTFSSEYIFFIMPFLRPFIANSIVMARANTRGRNPILTFPTIIALIPIISAISITTTENTSK